MLNILQNRDRINLGLLLLIAIALPWPMKYSNFGVGFLAIFWILTFDFKAKWQKIKENKILLVCSSVIYLLSIYGLLFTSNLKQGFFILEVRLAFLLLPLIVLSLPNLERKQVKLLAKGFAWSCIVAMTFSLAFASTRFFELYMHGFSNHNIFTIDLLSKLQYSHVYFGLYLNIALSIFTVTYFEGKKGRKETLVYSIIALYIYAFLILITAKMALITAVVLVIGYVILTQKRSLAIKFVLSVLICFGGLFSTLLYSNDAIRNRVEEFVRIKSTSVVVNNDRDYAATRIGPWKCSYHLILDYGVVGLGTGDVQDVMDNWYQSHGLSNLVKYGSHNQYMNMLLSFGIIGLFSFIICLLSLFKLSISEQYPLYLLFLLVFSMSCCTENVFDANKGVVLFSFFNTLFLSSLKLTSR